MANRDSILEAIRRGPGSPGSSSTVTPDQREVVKSIRTGQRQLGLSDEELESHTSGAPSVLSRIVDVASRPLYGVANVIKESSEGRINLLSSAWEGISGQEKTRMSDVLEAMGTESNVAQGIGGLALDVAFDPLTYVGGGIVKKVAAEKVAAEAGRSFTKVTEQIARGAYKGPGKIMMETAGINAKTAALREGITDPKILSKVAEEAQQEFGTALAMKASDDTARALQEAAPGAFEFRYMGKPFARSERLYRGGRKAADVVKGTSVGNAFNKAFRPQATFVAGTNGVGRHIDSVGMANAEVYAKTFTQGGMINDIILPTDLPFAKITTENAESIAHAIERGDDLAELGFSAHVAGTKGMFRKFDGDEYGTFIQGGKLLREAGEDLDNFVPHFYDPAKNDMGTVGRFMKARKAEARKLEAERQAFAAKAGESAARKAEKDTVGKLAARSQAVQGAKEAGITNANEIDKLARLAEKDFVEQAYNKAGHAAGQAFQKKSTYTLERAMSPEWNLKPETDIRKIMGNEIKKHFTRMGRVRFASAVHGEFGVRLGVGEAAQNSAKRLGLVEASNPYMPKGTYLPKEIDNAMKSLDNIFYGDEAAGSALAQVYDNALGYLKFGQTVINPGHHVRNLMSDVTLNFLDGVVTAAPYKWAAQIQRAYVKSSKNIQTQLANGEITVKDILQNVDEIKVPVGGLELNGQQIFDRFVGAGAKPGMYRTELAVRQNGFMEKIRSMSETREEFARLAHFIDAFQKEGKNLTAKSTMKQIDDAAARAGARVRKFNIDYGDLTPFEQKVMKRVVPFYTFMRKNLPLQIESLFLRPGRSLALPKAASNLQVAMGGDGEVDILGLNGIPDYMKSAMYVNLIGEGEGRNGVYWNPASAFPLMDLERTFGAGSFRDVAEGQLAGLTPFAQFPIRQITGYDFFTGRPTSKGPLQNLVETLPMGRLAYGATAGDTSTEGNRDRIINLLTGTGVKTLEPGQIQGELRRQEDVIQMLLRRRREREAQAGG